MHSAATAFFVVLHRLWRCVELNEIVRAGGDNSDRAMGIFYEVRFMGIFAYKQ
jgi:hypothetical protein